MHQNHWIACIATAMLALQLPTRAGDSPRITPTVKLIEQIRTAVVPVFTETGKGSYGSGSGAVIHRRGFIMTADHVTQAYTGVVLFGLKRVPYRVVGRSPEKDVAILKVDASHVQSIIPLGRSHDLRAGEPIVVGGNPSGRGIVFSRGIVNSPSIDPSWPSIFVKSFWRTEMEEAQKRQLQSTGGRPDFIQFDASSNRGNSGGPLINAEGRLIGVVSQKSFEEDAINWAIPIDRIRLLVPYLVQPEEVAGLWVGIEMDTLAERAMIRRVSEDSPAWKAGIRAGDVLVSVDGDCLTSGVDWLLLLEGRKPGDQMRVTWDRQGETSTAKLRLVKQRSATIITLDKKVSGLDYALYRGRYAAIPDFEKLKPAETGTAESVSAETIVDEEAENFAIVFRGYAAFPDAGLYRLYLGSDDGSKLYVNNRLVIDNDLPHPYQELSRWVRVPKGLVPIRVEYAETSGAQALKLFAKRDMDSEDTVRLQFFRDE